MPDDVPDHADVYPRRAIRAQRLPGAPGRPDGWSTLIRRTWHSEAEFEAEFVDAAVFNGFLAAVEELALAVETEYEVGWASVAPPGRIDHALRVLRSAQRAYDGR